MHRVWIGISLAALVLIGGCGYSSNESAEEHAQVDGEILRRGIGGEPSSLDPGQAGDIFSFELIRDLYEGLISESPNGEVQPGTAASWTVNATSTQYTFQLRKNARWSNGNPVRAQDFVTAWRRVVDPRRGSPVADLLRPVANAAEIIAGRLPPTQLGVRAEQDNILVIQLTEPTPYFLQLLSHTATFPIFSEESAKAHGAKEWVSNGPYVLSNWTPGGSIKLTRNAEYWDQQNTSIKRVEYHPLPDELSEFTQYRAGQLDITSTVPASSLPLIREKYSSELSVAPFLGTVYYAFNLRSPYGHINSKAREALAMAVDRKALEQTILIFGQSPAYGFVPPGTWNYKPQSWQWELTSDTERIARARELYKAAGYSTSRPLHLRVLLNATPAIRRLTSAIAAMWKESLGVEAELIDEEYRVFLDSRKDPSRWDIARLGWVADYNDAANFLDIFRQASPNNDEGFANSDYDSLLNKAASTPNSADRRASLEAAERLMLSDYPIIPVYFYSSKRLIKPYIKGVEPNALNKLYTKHLSITAH